DLTPEVVNLGGGFGIPYFTGQPRLDVDALTTSLTDALTAFRAEHPRLSNSRLMLELGRYLMADFGIYVARVVDIKETRGKRFVILDGGMHHAFPATGNFGQVIKKNYPVLNASHPDAEPSTHEVV